ncbi:DNA phosphorothioation-dependent restriction protein DptH [Mesobacillus jeotgali]|uniref:DNA phosphorothioation-dependent restriction protein DptH n=1 Tax=Mesobacillus jeotgali TaxID=129985 RepID=UPI001786F189|nr:DNA phosphorothioation-dependent restriction protein DptH [Mesobacillus jeotgali]UYZ24026.1 DNA phosphorothioation-dependent restriction protein DptH [Mesobacillus jeotgali]
MSNQFYKYISTLLVNYFRDTGVNDGDRYYLQLDRDSDVKNLVESLKLIQGTKRFNYKHELGEEYVTFSIPFGSVQLVIAYTSNNVTPDFLVTLRNLVGEQEGVWKNTALLSIVSEQLDSIQGGSSDLQKEGMPLHPNSLFNNLKTEIENSVIPKVDQIILLDNLENLMKDQAFQQITFFEFEDIFSTLQKGSIGNDEYSKFGLFKDPDLSTFKGKDQKERLKENRELYDFVRKVHDLGLGEEELEKRFTSEGAKELQGERWKDIEYPKVNKFKVVEKKKKIEYSGLNIKGKLKVWNRPQKETAAGKRKRHIVIFTGDENNSIDLDISFNLFGEIKSLSKEYLNYPKNSNGIEINVKNKNIGVRLTPIQNEVTFHKFSYKHEKKASLGTEFFIALIPINPLYIDSFKSSYLVNVDSGFLEIQFDADEFSFGDGFENKKVEIRSDKEKHSLTQDMKLTVIPLPEAYNDNDELSLYIEFDQVTLPFLLKNELPDSMPITGQRIWKLIRETGKDIQWIKENNRLILENREFYFHPEYRNFFEWEDLWVEEGMRFAIFESDELKSTDIKLNDDLREAYSRFVTYFKIRNSIPSLCTITEEYRARALEYINEYQKAINDFQSGVPAGSKGVDLFSLGTIHANGQIYFSPFHPLMVAFKLKLYELLEGEEIENSILNRLSPDALIPFLYEKNHLYKPDHQQAAMEWLCFKPVNRVSVSDANLYLAKVVNDKISQFKEHFAYLFIQKSMAPLQINVINISNDKEVLRGILQWMIKEIESGGKESLKPIEITLYNDDDFESSFDLYSRTETVSEFETNFNVKLKVKDLDEDEVLRTIRERLFYFKQKSLNDFRYAHISFYKMHAQEKHAVQPMKDMTTGIAIDGLYASVPSMKDEENYKSGFGTKNYTLDDQNYLACTSFLVNELAANLRNGGHDSYRKGEAIFSRTTTADEELLKNIFNSSYWVTFVDPSMDLEFFDKFDENLVVIHYSDQYSSSSRYDAITVTDKSNQYYAVIKEFLKNKDIKGTDDNVFNTIKAFNTFNGEWLLRIIGSKGHFDREKLSIISAIKYSVSYFDHPNILWVPISLEEILRVAGAVSLNKSEGVFTAKNLGVKGSHSDDLLLLGLENYNGEVSLHFYPVEVKIGINKGEVLDKARKQVQKTSELLYNTLTGENANSFTAKFYRNFFAQLLIANAYKLHSSEFWNEKSYELTSDVIEKLLKDDYKITSTFRDYIGMGAILSFQKNAYHRSAQLEDGIQLLNLTENDGYEGLIIPINTMRNWIQNEPNDFVKEDMLSVKYRAGETIIETETEEKLLVTGNIHEEYETTNGDSTGKKIKLDDRETEDVHEQEQDGDEEETGGTVETSDSTVNREDFNQEKAESLEKLRIKIGKAENSNKEIFWEYGNKGLANRHLLISGKSGQGKTYFMQCLLLEKSKMGIPSIVIDYTEGFLPNQLEPEFVEYLGNKITQKIVYSEKLPINPFQKNQRDIGGIQLPESDTDVAERIKSVFAAVYKSLGIQQQNAIYEAVLNGLNKYGEHMDLSKLKETLEEDGSSYAKTALSQIRPLIDRNPFNNDQSFSWKDIVDSNGQVYIIQLTGFPRDVQLMITEFILWDLWNYSVRFGNKNKPMPVIMDEAQNLDHTEKSPSARILTEGRKFGWSAWYATQFLKSQLDSDELARLQNSSEKIYFSPPEQELSTIASSLSKDPQDKKYWENKLATLRKGQCIVHGPIQTENGTLSTPTVTVVDISPLTERI